METLKESLDYEKYKVTSSSKKHVKSSWISRHDQSQTVEKPWGHETTWSGFKGVHGKTLFIKAGMRTSFKYHQLKTEVLFLRSGKATVLYGTECSLSDPKGHPLKTDTLGEGDSLNVQSGCPYRISAVSDCEIIEIGDNLSNSPIRVEDDFDRGRIDSQEGKDINHEE